MRKILVFLLITCVALSTFALVGCGHECTFKSVWSTSDTHHWHDCEGENCEKVDGYASHTFVDGTCSVCSKHVCDFKSEWTNDDTHHWHDCKGATCLERSGYSEHSFENGVCVCGKTDSSSTVAKLDRYSTACNTVANGMKNLTPAQPSSTNASGVIYPTLLNSNEPIHNVDTFQGYIMIKGVSTYVKLLADMMNNPAFVLTDEAIIFTASFSSADLTYVETFTAYLTYSFDEENDKIKMTWDVDSVINGQSMNILMYLDIDYDFETGNLSSFQIKSIQSGMAFSVKYDGIDVRSFFTYDSSYDYYFAPEQEAIDAKKPTAINLNADFSTEYTTAMLTMNPQFAQ